MFPSLHSISDFDKDLIKWLMWRYYVDLSQKTSVDKLAVSFLSTPNQALYFLQKLTKLF